MRLQPALLALGFTVMTGIVASSPAHAYDRRYCMIGNGFTFPGYCAYDTYASCMASASGFSAYCNVNPRFAFNPQAGDRKPKDGWNLSPFLFGNRGVLQ